MKLKIAIIGFGVVGQGLARHLISKKQYLRSRYNIDCDVVAICDLKHGSIICDSGVDLVRVLRLIDYGRRIDEYEGVARGFSALEVIDQTTADIIVEATWTNLETGEPGLTHIKRSLERGIHVVTSNKGPIALAYKELGRIAESKGVFLRFEATVMSGTPAINLGLECLAGAEIKCLRGILNGTTNYILTEMGRGVDYIEALRKAQELGYAEADPTADVEAWDPVAKIVILSNVLMNGDLRIKDVERRGITNISLKDIDEAKRRSRVIKLIAKAEKINGRITASVKPEEIPLTDPLAHVDGVLNALTYVTDVQGDVTIIGPGAGGDSAGYALLSDILAIAHYIT
ncbi:MAG: homoserine dehydrogenase [Candidatus Methanomethylicia archaeon]